MTQAIAAKGTLFKIGDGGGPETFVTVAEVDDISGPQLKAATINVTSHSSGGWEEFIAGLKDGGQVTLAINWVPTAATHNATTGLIRDFKNGTLRNFQVVWPDAGSTTWSFAALVDGFDPGAKVGDKLTAKVSLKVSGAPTLA